MSCYYYSSMYVCMLVCRFPWYVTCTKCIRTYIGIFCNYAGYILHHHIIYAMKNIDVHVYTYIHVNI